MHHKKRRALKPRQKNLEKDGAASTVHSPNSSRRRLWLLLVTLSLLVSLAVACRKPIAGYFANSAGNIKYIHQRPAAERLLAVARLFSDDVPQIALARARWERRDGNLQASLELLEQAVARGAAAAELDLERSLFAAQQNPSPATDKQLIRLLENHSDHRDDICLAYSLGYLSHRQYDSAQLLLTGWSEDDLKNPLPLALLGTLHAEQKKVNDAESYYRSALQLDPSHPIATFGLAELLARNGRPKESLVYYELASKHKTQQSHLAAVAGWSDALQALGKTDQARDVLDSFLEQNPQDSALRTRRANVALEEGDFDLVVKLLQPEIDRGAKQQTVNHLYAIAQRRLNNLDIAERHFQLAAEAAKEGSSMLQLNAQLSLDPDNIELKYEIGWRNLRYGNPNEGLFWLSQVLKVDSQHANTHRALAEYYSNLSEPTEATRKLAEVHNRLASSSTQNVTETP